MFKQKIRNLHSSARIMSQIMFRDIEEYKVKEVRKTIKKIYLKEFPNYKQTRQPEELINSFRTYADHGESFTDVYIFTGGKETMERIRQNMNLEGDINHSMHDCTGLWYRRPAEIKEFKDRIVVIQGCILDC